MTADEYASGWRFAAALFPQAFEPGSESIQAAWAASFLRFSQTAFCTAIEQAAKRRSEFPSHHQLLEACKELEQPRYEALPAPKPMSERQLGDLDKFVNSMCQGGMDRPVGSFEARAYQIVAAGGPRTFAALNVGGIDTTKRYSSVTKFLSEMGYQPASGGAM